MRRLTAILLLGVLLYNWLGYRLVYDCLQHRAAKELEARLDGEDYDESRLIEIRVPLNLPYISSWSEFERYDGEIEIDGQHYKYVKRRVYNGSLILLCLPNEKGQKIREACNDYFKQVNDLQHPSKNKSGNTTVFFKSLQAEYRPEVNDWSIARPAAHRCTHHPQDFCLISRYKKDTPEQPPEQPVA